MPSVRPDPYETARRALGHEFPDIVELGRNAGTTAFLGRRAGGEVAVLLVKPSHGNPEYLLEVDALLEADFPVGRTTCAACGTPQSGWPRFCDACKADLAGAEPDTALSVAPDGYELLGSLRRKEGGGPLYFAREAATGRVVGLSARRGLAGGLELSPAWTPAGSAARSRRAVMAAAGTLAAAVLALALAAGLREQGAAGAAGPTTRLAAGPSTRSAPPAGTGTVAGAPGGSGAAPTSVPPAGREPAAPGTPPGSGSPDRPASLAAEPSPTGTQGRRDAPGTTSNPSVSSPPAPSEPAVPTPRGVEDAIGRYASAVGSGRTSRIAQAYPGITPAEVSRWDRFFAPLGRDAGLRAWYDVVSGPTIAGDRAEVIFTLTVAYANGAGEPVERPLPLRARLRWTGSAWTLQEVLLLQ